MDSGESLQKAITLHEAGKFGEAAAIYRDLLTRDPQNVMVMHLLALVAMQFDQPNMVLALSEEGLRLQPGLAVLHQDRATALRRLGRKEEALKAIQHAVELDPQQAGLYDTLSSIQRDMRQYDRAVESLRTAIKLDPNDAKFYNHLGICLGRMGANEEALSYLNRYVAMKPDMAEGYNNRANILKSLRRYREALDNYSKALAINPHIFMGNANKGITHLVLGDYEEGWKLFEGRMPGNMPPEAKRFDPARRWKGETAAAATLVLYNEQGLGDTLQFCRYVPLVKPRVGKLVLQVQRGLVPLLKLQWPDITFLTDEDPVPAHDLQCPFMSLPAIFGTRMDTVPFAMPYLKADPSKAAAWKERLGKDSAKRVGLVWAGNPDHMNDHLRSIPLAQLAPLWDVPGVHFYSLQKGDKALGETACLPAALPFTLLGDELKDFTDTAALLSALDVLVTVDTATLHMAGALGVPSYVLLQYDPDWRWMAERADTPWYESVTLFRQSRFGKWEEPVAALRHKLAAFLA